MSYKSISPQLKSSCYNCTHFQASHDMLNGLCFRSSPEGVETAGIGTCSRFAMKSMAESAALPRSARRAADAASRRATAAR
ncbi:hypothetical protein [Paenibacillus sp. GYB003]|uniref:hypothetical protein n=1 Tax=Paenibacillus sp. GYB003 TaxID=2994392 RepID=UPI002F961080